MKAKNILIVTLFAVVIFGFSALFLFLPAEQYSVGERRILAQKPDITVEKLSDGSYMSEFETYTLDQFPLRENLRTLKGLTVLNLFARKDNNGLYSQSGHLSKLEYPLDEASLDRNIRKLREVYDSMIAPSGCTLYLSVIPDKNCFLAPLGNSPVLSYTQIKEALCSELPEGVCIDISGLLSPDDFYRTDQHWRQEAVTDVAEALLQGMGAPAPGSFTENELAVPFYGTYAGQSALPCSPDKIIYLTDEAAKSCSVVSYGTGTAREAVMYDMAKAEGRDPYEMFLGGSEPLIEITNPLCTSGRELIIFRDSFCSSLAPLMVGSYSRITLVDLRYMQSSMLPNFITFRNQDVLFLYSTLILNNTISA